MMVSSDFFFFFHTQMLQQQKFCWKGGYRKAPPLPCSQLLVPFKLHNWAISNASNQEYVMLIA